MSLSRVASVCKQKKARSNEHTVLLHVQNLLYSTCNWSAYTTQIQHLPHLM